MWTVSDRKLLVQQFVNYALSRTEKRKVCSWNMSWSRGRIPAFINAKIDVFIRPVVGGGKKIVSFVCLSSSPWRLL